MNDMPGNTISEEVVSVTFDVSLITLDEMLEVFEIGGKSQATQEEGLKMLRSMRKCLVASSRPLTGADLQGVVKQFVLHVINGGNDGKN